MNERLKQMLVIAATVLVIIANSLATAGFINDKTPGELSDKYITQITPAGYAFGVIWSLIYLGLIVFSIYQALAANEDNRFFKRIRTVYIVNCLANCAWIFAWHYELIPLSIIIMMVLLTTLVFINVVLIRADATAELLTTKVPFNLYFGWITVATILNASITLVYFGVQMSAAIGSIIGAILILIATALGVLLRFELSAFFYPIAIAWGLTAIAVKQSGDTIVVVASAIGVISLLIAALAGFVKDD